MHRLPTIKEKIIMFIVWRLPKDIVKWCVSRAFAHATTGKHSNQLGGELTVVTMLDRWRTSNE